MNKIDLPYLAIILLGTSSSTHIAQGSSMERVYSFFGKYANETVIEKEYQLTKPGILTINNIDGDITVSTEWKRNSICLKAIKKAAKADDLDLFTIKTSRKDQFDGHHLTLTTACTNKAAKGAISYQLIVPEHITLNLHTERGTIKVHDVHGAVTANTINGRIELKNVGNTIIAQTEETGPIVIDQAKGNIKATTHNGNINITDTAKSVLASTHKGNIITACTTVPSRSKIVLNSETQGAITLSLPSSVNAKLQGKTTKGRLTSDHYVTIKPYTTKLNRESRKEFERHVDGVIGTGEADIRLSCNTGNIMILESKTT